MTQYEDVVERQKILLEAEEWAKCIQQIHVHSLTNMWYEKNPEDMETGAVTDIHYNDGRIVRTKNDHVLRVMGDIVSGDALIDKYLQLG